MMMMMMMCNFCVFVAELSAALQFAVPFLFHAPVC